MRAKFGRDPTAGSKKLPFKFISRLIEGADTTNSDNEFQTSLAEKSPPT